MKIPEQVLFHQNLKIVKELASVNKFFEDN